MAQKKEVEKDVAMETAAEETTPETGTAEVEVAGEEADAFALPAAEEAAGADAGEDGESEEDFLKRGMASATRTERKDIYKEIGRIVYGQGVNAQEVETDASKRRKDYLELAASFNSGKILEGVIGGYRDADSNASSKAAVPILADVMFGNGSFSVYIPTYALFEHPAERYATQEGRQSVENEMTRRINAPVRFRVLNVDEKRGVAYASALEAMEKDGEANYVRLQKDGHPLVYEDIIVAAPVIAVARTYVKVNAMGAIIRIPTDEISHLHIGDARDLYSCGDVVNVRIKSVGNKEVTLGSKKYTLISATGSIKDCKKNPKDIYLHQFREGGVYSGVVSYVEDYGVFVILNDKIDCLCALPKAGRIPIKGDKKVIRVTEISEKEKRVFGLIINS